MSVENHWKCIILWWTSKILKNCHRSLVPFLGSWPRLKLLRVYRRVRKDPQGENVFPDLLDKQRMSQEKEVYFGFLSAPPQSSLHPRKKEIVGRKSRMLRSLFLGHNIRAGNQYLQINITQIPSFLELAAIHNPHCLPGTQGSQWPTMFYYNNPCYVLISIAQIGGTLLVTLRVWPVKP